MVDDANTTMLYNSIFKVVHDTHHGSGTWNYWLCQLISDGKYFVYAVPHGYELRDERVSVKKYLTGFCFGEESRDYAGSVMMAIVEEANAYFAADNLTVEWIMTGESYDMQPVEVRDVESGVNSPDR